MADCSIINQKKSISFQLIPATKPMHSIAPVTDSDFNTHQTQIAESIFLNFSAVLRKPIISKMINHNHIFLILVNVTDDDSVTTFSPDGSINLSFIFGGTVRSDATLISGTTSTYTRNSLVRKFSDGPGNGNNVPIQNNNQNQNTHNHNQNNNVPIRIQENSGINGNANGGNDGGNGGNGNAATAASIGNNEWIQPIRIYRIEVYPSVLIHRPVIRTNIFAFEYDSWEALAAAIYDAWLKRHNIRENNQVLDTAEINIHSCVPDSVTYYGRYEEGNYYEFRKAPQYPWEAVKLLIRDVRVYRQCI